MKTKSIILATLFAAAIFAGCNKNDGEQAVGEAQIMVVKLPDGINTRAVDAVNAGGDIGADVSNVHVFLMNGEAVAHYDFFKPEEITAKKKEFKNVSNSVNSVIVVANVPTANVTAVAALKNATAIKSFGFTAASQQVDITELTLLGQGSVVTVSEGLKEAEVKLNSLTARFEIGAVKPGEGIESIAIKGVFINNYYATNAKGTPVNNQPTDAYWTYNVTGTGVTSTVTFSTAYSEPTYFHGGSDEVNLTAASKCYAFHVFAGDNIPQIVLVVAGKYADKYYDPTDPDNQYFVKYATIKSYKKSGGSSDLTSIEANKIYKIGTGATGIEITPGGITEKPNEKETFLDVTVKIEEWAVETLTPSIIGN